MNKWMDGKKWKDERIKNELRNKWINKWMDGKGWSINWLET